MAKIHNEGAIPVAAHLSRVAAKLERWCNKRRNNQKAHSNDAKL